MEVDDGQAEFAFRAEIAYYLEHHVEGRDPDSLDDLRDRCAAVLRDALAVPEVSHAVAREALLASIRFEAYPDAAPALRDLRRRGLRVVVCSNWDCSLPAVLREADLIDLLDGVATSADAGASKPDPRIFAAGLELARSSPEHAIYVGDSPANDVAGAAAAGLRAVLLRRPGPRPDRVAADRAPGPDPAAVISGLGELARVI